MALAQRGLPEIVARVLAARGIGLGEVASFLAPRCATCCPILPAQGHARRGGTARGGDRGGESIAVFGDYDVDGATAAALLLRFLARRRRPPRLYVPDRLREGYGPNAPALLR